MTPAAVFERATRVAEVRADTAASPSGLSSALVDLRQIKAWVASSEAAIVQQLAAVDSFAESTIAEASKESLGAAAKTTERAATLGRTPSLAASLDDGVITAGHIDAVTRGSGRLEPEQRNELFDRVDRLATVAAASTIEEFQRRVRLEVRQMQRDDGESRLERQKRATRVSTWTDDEGMWNLRGRFDPETALHLSARLSGAVETLFVEQVPDCCPTDPIEKQKFLTAHALARLVHSDVSAPAGAPQVLVVIDADAPEQPGPSAQWSIPVELPPRVLAELADDATVTSVVVRNGVVLHAPGALNLGRSSRLANRAQRRALRGLYSTCAIPGCAVHYDRCKLHHIVWWRNGGETNLDNLLPVCTKHHTKIHHDGWVVHLGTDRVLMLTLPDGTRRSTGPPSIRAA